MPNFPIFKCFSCLVAPANFWILSKSSSLNTLLLWTTKAGPCDSTMSGKNSFLRLIL